MLVSDTHAGQQLRQRRRRGRERRARPPFGKGDRLLDVIAAAGGVRAPVNETFVELSRGSPTSRVPLTRVIDNPSENIYLHPNDVVTLVRDPQTFIAYGATGSKTPRSPSTRTG